MDRLNALVVGGGLGGLTAAACLLQRGHDARVFEQADVLTEVGAGIQLSANAVKVLYALGLRDELEDVVVRPEKYIFRRFDTGEVVNEIPLGREHQNKYGAPYLHAHRADIHDMLVRRVRALQPAAISLGCQVASFAESRDGVRLAFANGASAAGDVLIGADGIKSTVRKQLLGDTPVNYTGDIAWRALIPMERLPAEMMGRVITVWCGPHKHAVMYYVRGGTLLNFVATVEREVGAEESWTQKRPWAELKADFRGWHADMQAVIDAVDKDNCYQWALNNRLPVANWSSDRATLLGDAAHATLPYLAQGAAMAIEDAAVLTRCFADCDTVHRALRLYQANRIDRTGWVVFESTNMRTLYRIENEQAMKAAFQRTDLARARGELLYSYDPMSVALTEERP